MEVAGDAGVVFDAAVGAEWAVSGLLPGAYPGEQEAVVVLDEGGAAAVAAAADAFEVGALGWFVEAKFEPVVVDVVDLIGDAAERSVEAALSTCAFA